MAEQEPLYWFSLPGGMHIPVYEGQSKQDAYKKWQIDNAKSTADKLNAEQKYMDTLKQGNGVSLKDDKLYFKGQPIDKLDTSEVDSESSLSPYLDKNGNVSQERLAVHQQIIQNYFGTHKPYPPGAEKWAYFTGGGAASGKGQFAKDVGKFYVNDSKPIVIDSDEIKKMLSKTDLGTDKLDKISTAFYHEESSALAKQIYITALKNNFPVMFDGTATSINSALKKIDQASKYGYKTQMNFICTDPKTVLSNTMQRYSHTNRLVPIAHQFKAHQNAYSAVLGQFNKYDKFTLWDNSSKQMTKVATSTKGGKLNVADKSRWGKFQQSKSAFTLNKNTVKTFKSSVHAIDKRKGGK